MPAAWRVFDGIFWLNVDRPKVEASFQVRMQGWWHSAGRTVVARPTFPPQIRRSCTPGESVLVYRDDSDRGTLLARTAGLVACDVWRVRVMLIRSVAREL